MRKRLIWNNISNSSSQLLYELIIGRNLSS